MKLSLIDLYFLGFLESNILKTYGNERTKFSHYDKNGNKNLFKFSSELVLSGDKLLLWLNCS